MRPVPLGATLLLALCGCATATPTLAPARVLLPRRVVLDVGTAYVRPTDPSALREVAALASSGASGGSVQTREQVFAAALAYGPTPPGVASYFAGRVGLGASAEGHVALAGRFVRVGARRVLYASGNWSLAAALDGRFALLGGASERAVPGLTLDGARLLGGDAALALGYTRRDMYDGYLVVRGGGLYGGATMAHASLGPTAFDATFSRWELGVTMGARVGFGHAGVAIEVEGVYAVTNGAGGGLEARATSFALVPAAAVSYQF